jgi:trk system potassium uptake protein TrkA|tara:strand:+ start:3495 stop:4826 length:1332 start_codon:yes stop_codon:yes gene_type:complete
LKKIIIIGAGEVGNFLAGKLSSEQHDVTVIEADAIKVEELNSSLDALVIYGNGGSPSSLLQAGAESADLIIAVTDDENVNMLSCYLAKNMGTKKSFARVQDSSLKSELDDLNIDQIIDPSESACDEIEKLLSRAGIYDIHEFSGGKILSVGGVLTDDSPLINKQLSDVHEFGGRENWLVTAYVREGVSYIANGDTVLNTDDHIKIIVKSGDIQTATALIGIDFNYQIKKVIIIGASRSSELLAERLYRDYEVVIIDDNKKDCNRIAENNSHVIVVNNDPRDPKNLIDLGVGLDTAIVALSKDDSKNIVCSLVGNALGVPEIITRVNKIDYLELLKETSIQATISTRITAANSILQDVRSDQVKSALTFEDTEVEALEILLSENCHVLDKSLTELELPKNCLIAGVTRREKTYIPSGDWKFGNKDRLIVFTLPESIDEIENVFC